MQSIIYIRALVSKLSGSAKPGGGGGTSGGTGVMAGSAFMASIGAAGGVADNTPRSSLGSSTGRGTSSGGAGGGGGSVGVGEDKSASHSPDSSLRSSPRSTTSSPKSSASAATAPVPALLHPGAGGAEEGGALMAACDLLAWRCAEARASGRLRAGPAGAAAPATWLVGLGLALPQPSRAPEPNALVFREAGQIAEQVRTVRLEKKKEEGRLVREAGHHHAVRQKRPQLFQYKYYREQVPLQLGQEEMEQVVNAVVSPPPDDPESHLIASKILIKLLIDIYCGDERAASQLLLSILFELLAAPSAEVRLHAFNLLFNLSIHMNLLEETALLAEVSSPAPTSPEADRGRQQIERIQEELLQVCLEILLLLLQRQEEDERVWLAGLNCLLYFTTQDGRLVTRRLVHLDPRVLPVLLQQVGPARDLLQKHLVHLFVHRLYQHHHPPPPSSQLQPQPQPQPQQASAARAGHLNLALLRRCGGMGVVASLFVQQRSLQAISNLFLVLYDAAVAQLVLEHRLERDSEQPLLLLELLRRYDASLLYQSAFRYLPEGFTESLLRFLLLEQPKRDAWTAELAARLDRGVAQAILTELERLAQAQQRLEPEFEVRLQAMQAHPENQAENLRLLAELLHSPDEAARRNGEAWLFALLRQPYDGSKLASLALINAVDTQFTKLLHSPLPQVRRIYLSITERTTLLLRAKAALSPEEHRPEAVFKVLNDNLSRLSLPQFRERNEHNLMYVFDMIFNLISHRLPDVSSATLPHAADDPYRDEPDSNYELFLAGRVAVSKELLRLVHVQILHQLFLQMPPSSNLHNFNRVRTALLLLLIERCRDPQALDQVGIGFFRQLLADRCPEIAYHASRFLIDQLQAERPEQYTAILNTLLSKAQLTNDEQLLANPYLQINEMIRGFAQDGQQQQQQQQPQAASSSPSTFDSSVQSVKRT